MSSGSETQKPSSEKTRTFARERAIAPSSASCSPFEADRDGADRLHGGVARRRRRGARSCSTTPAVSATGNVFAIAKTAVNPPAAAARVPVSTVSLCS